MCDRVGILEQGRLLATGTVDEIRRTLTQSRDIVVRIAANRTAAMNLLSTLDAVQDLRSDGATIHFAINGGDEEQIKVLHLLCRCRIDVLEYSSRGESLEDVFLQDHAGTSAMSEAEPNRRLTRLGVTSTRSRWAANPTRSPITRWPWMPMASGCGVGSTAVCQRVADWLNPILIKEARQSLKSRQFIITFFLLLAASCVWTIFGVVINAPDVYYVPDGRKPVGRLLLCAGDSAGRHGPAGGISLARRGNR